MDLRDIVTPAPAPNPQCDDYIPDPDLGPHPWTEVTIQGGVRADEPVESYSDGDVERQRGAACAGAADPLQDGGRAHLPDLNG
eukprot:COSAG05_NODE_978_length_6327_cov_7.588150_5_plen_83_part_00